MSCERKISCAWAAAKCVLVDGICADCVSYRELCAKMGKCVMDFAWSYEQGDEMGKHYDFRCCGGSHTISFAELGIKDGAIQASIRDLFRH